jgi:ribonuclease HII
MPQTASCDRLLRFDWEASAAGSQRMAGVDEAGRGCWAGPVLAAAVILPPGWGPQGLNDSKRLSAPQREALFAEIVRHAVGWSACAVPADVIDTINILQATLQAMQRAVRRLCPAPDMVLVDGRQLPSLDCPGLALVGGDGKSATIAAASILAKVLRDRVMRVWDRHYPGYGFTSHKGYGCRRHREALIRLGPCRLHRRSYKPVAGLRQGRLWNGIG